MLTIVHAVAVGAAAVGGSAAVGAPVCDTGMVVSRLPFRKTYSLFRRLIFFSLFLMRPKR